MRYWPILATDTAVSQPMKDMTWPYNPNFFARPDASYWMETTRPLVCLVFVLPWLLAYELGVWFLGQCAVRNGAELWLRRWLEHIGLGQYMLLPVLVIVGLLSWHYVRRDSWTLQGFVLAAMTAESLVWAAVFLGIAHLCYPWCTRLDHCTWGVNLHRWHAAALVTYCGAGIYEEVLFRLALLPVLAMIAHACGCSPPVGCCVATVVSSALFAAVHYQVELPMENVRVCILYGDAFQWSSFLFRFLAGVGFAVLFFTRGFGIAVGTHALYDILAALF